MSTRPLMTAEQLGQRLNLHPATLLKWARQKRIPAWRFSKKAVRFDIDEVAEAVRGRTPEPRTSSVD